MNKENEASRATGNTTDKSILTPSSLYSKPQVSLNNQEAQVSSLFKKFGTITQFIAYDEHKIMRLAARICDMKDKGAVINTVKKDVYHDGVCNPGVAFYTLVGWEG